MNEIIRYIRYSLIDDIRAIPRRIINFFHRGYYGWAHTDTWNLDNYLSKVIGQSIKHLHSYQNGLPTWSEGRPEKQAKKEWDEIIIKIILAFELADQYINFDITDEEWKNDYKSKYEEGMNLFRDNLFSLWD